MNKSFKFLKFRGKVQQVQFRRTILNACKNRKIEAGASNDKIHENCVELSLFAEYDKIEQFMKDAEGFVIGKKPLNDWGALITAIEEQNQAKSLEEHEYNTSNFESRIWKDCIFYFK